MRTRYMLKLILGFEVFRSISTASLRGPHIPTWKMLPALNSTVATRYLDGELEAVRVINSQPARSITQGVEPGQCSNRAVLLKRVSQST